MENVSNIANINIITNPLNIWISRAELVLASMLLVSIIALIVIKKNSNRLEKVLYSILGTVVLLLASDVIVFHSYGNLTALAHNVETIFNLLYYACNYFSAWLIIKYSFEFIKKNGGTVNRKIDLFSDVIIIVSVLTLFINIFTEKIYYIDEFNVYQRGDWYLLSLVPLALIVIVILVILSNYRKKLLFSEKLVLNLSVFLPLSAEAILIFSSGVSFQAISRAIVGFILLLQYVLVGTGNSVGYKYDNISRDSKKLQTRIIIFVCVIITVFFGLIAKIAIGFASNQMNKEIEAHYQMLANKTTEQASAWIVRETQILVNQKASLEIINNFDHDFLTEYFTYIDKDYNYDNYIYDMYFTNPQNDLACGSGYIQDPEIDFRLRDWYVGAQSSDNVCYTAPYVDADSGKSIVTVSIKVFDRSRRFVGVLALDIFVDKLFTITEQESLPEDSYLFIVGNELELITHPNKEFGYIEDTPQNMRGLNDANYNKLADFILGDNPENSYINFVDYDGTRRCFFVSKVDDCDWYVVAAISSGVIEQSQRNLNESIFIALIVCLVLGIIITLWLTNNIIKKLSEAQEEATAASAAKSRFLANMSHEIRTPINAVLGMDEMLLRECQDENLKEYARNIQSAGQALLGVVNDILDFSKIESDKLDLVPGNYEIGELIGSCINLIKLRANEKKLSFTIERDDYIPKTVYGDEIRIRQIISNLLTNAVKYTKEGGVTLFAGWEKVDEQNGKLIIKVKDTGMGIKPEGMADLFNSFQRLDEKKNRNIEGTGLGLAITKRLIDLMGGEIKVESEYGKGSEFKVIIPQRVINGENTAALGISREEDNKENKEKIVLNTKDAKILVVDDVSMNLKVVKGLLKGTGLTIDTAKRGLEAIEMIKENSYDVIFLDHMMPEMDGIETLKLLKEKYSKELGNTPVIMLTANAVLGVEDMYKSEGFVDYLSKPVDREALCRCLIKFLPENKVI